MIVVYLFEDDDGTFARDTELGKRVFASGRYELVVIVGSGDLHESVRLIVRGAEFLHSAELCRISLSIYHQKFCTCFALHVHTS